MLSVRLKKNCISIYEWPNRSVLLVWLQYTKLIEDIFKKFNG